MFSSTLTVCVLEPEAGWRDGSAGQAPSALAQDLSLVPSTYVRMLTAACNAGSRGIRGLWPLQTPTLVFTPTHVHVHD